MYDQAYRNGHILAGDCVYENCFICPLPRCKNEIKEEKQVTIENISKTIDVINNTFRLPPVPEKPKEGGSYMKREYYDANKEQIIAEIKQNGLKPTLKRWGISQATWATPGGLNNRWQAGFPWQYKYKQKRGNKPPVTNAPQIITKPGENITQNPNNITKPVSSTQNSVPVKEENPDKEPTRIGTFSVMVFTREIPAFPGFSNDWSDPVKLAWFEGFVCLVECSKVPAGAGSL